MLLTLMCGLGGLAAPAAAQSAQAAPTGVTVTPGNKQLTVGWTLPADAGGLTDATTLSGIYIMYNLGSSLDLLVASEVVLGAGVNGVFPTSHVITGLTNGQVYAVSVSVRYADNSESVAGTVTGTPAAQAPDAPAPTLTPDDQEIEVSWDAPADNGAAISDYGVRYKLSSAIAWTGHSHSGTGTSATIDGLTNGQSYEVQVQARNSVDWGAWSATASTTPGPRPDAPSLEGTLGSGDKFITLGWANPSDSSITGYQYRRKQGTSGAWSVWTGIPGSGASTVRYDFPAPVNFVTYYFQIRAVNLIGPGPVSGQLSAWAVSQLPAPAVTAVAGNEKVELDWTMPSGIIWGQFVIAYEYQMKQGVSGAWGVWTESSRGVSLSTTHTVTGLTNGVTYYFKVRAMGVADLGLASVEVSVTAGATAPSKPAIPTLTPGNRQLTVTWVEPADNGDAITDYDVQYWAGNSGQWTDANYTGTGTSTTIPSLTNGQSYQVQVRARNSVGWGGWSDSASDTPAAQAPDAPAPTLTPDDQEIEVTWDAPADNGDAITGYEVRYRPVTNPASAWTGHSHSGAGTSATIDGLTNGQSYQVQVRALNSVDWSGWSPSASATPGVRPAKPGGFAIYGAGDGSVTLGWTNPGDSSITGYQYQKKSTGDWGLWTNIPGSGAGTTRFTVTGLTNFVEYSLRVRAVNGIGPGPATAGFPGQPQGTLPAPVGLTAAPGHQKVELRWTMPSGVWVESIAYYDYQMKEASASVWGAWTESSNFQDGLSTTHAVTGLTNGATYEFKVRARGILAGLESSKASATPAVQAPSKPGVPALTLGDAQLEVSWDAPDANGAQITDYDVQYKLSSAGPNSWTEWNDSDTSTIIGATITGLSNGLSYDVQVRATNSAGNSLWSDSASGAPVAAAAAPAAPAALTLTPGDGQIQVFWNAPSDNGGAAITEYQVRVLLLDPNDERFDANADFPADSSARPATLITSTTIGVLLTNLANGVHHIVDVRARNSAGYGPWSDSAITTPVAAPAAPANFAAAAGDSEVTLTWDDPNWDDPNNAIITKWQYRQKAGAGSYGAWTDIRFSAHTVTGLANGTRYTFKLRAVNLSGPGAESDEASATPVAIPAAPANFAAAAGSGEVTLTWDNPNNPTITRWQYQQKEGSGNYGDWTAHPAQRRLDQFVHGHQSGQRHTLHVQVAGGECERQWRRIR